MNGVGTLVLDMEHLGHGGSEDIGIEQAHAIAQTRQGDGEIG